ncbi:unnamed protein product [Callosobruchus maculatus]|nr:unnamed protein product [Callosobruchus maculatus]
MQQVAQTERERDDYRAQLQATKKQLQETQDCQTKCDNKLGKTLQNLRALQEEKGSLEAKLGQKSIELQSQTEALHKKSEEVKQLRDKVVSLELSVSTGSDEKIKYEEKLEKMRMALARLEDEKRNLQDELARTESRSTKLELQRMSAEGDLQRLQMMLQEKDGVIQKLQEKCENQARMIAGLEERCMSLKSTIDQMTINLEKASQSEYDLKSEIQSLEKALNEAKTTSHTSAERLKQLQKQLANTENERRVLTERLEAAQQSLAELRRNHQILQDQVGRLNNELANVEVQKAGLESQLRMSHWDGGGSGGTGGGISHHEEELRSQLHASQRERSEMKGKLDALNTKLRQLESENSRLERLASKGVSPPSLRTKSYEHAEKYELDSTISELQKCQQEIKELRMKIMQLENVIADKDAELAKLRLQRPGLDITFDRSEVERYRAAQLQAERLLEAREQSHRQQVARLENQVSLLREQLNQEIKRRQQYLLRSSKTDREMQQLRQTLGESLRTVSQDPSLDALLLEHEARRLDNTLSATASLPPAFSSSYFRSSTPQPK